MLNLSAPRSAVAVIVLLCGGVCAGLADDAGRLALTAGPWAWQETPRGLQVQLEGKPLIALELVQLVDRSAGWQTVYQGGAEDAAPQAERLADDRTGTRCALDGRLKLARETWVADDKLHLAINCEIVDPGTATDFYYSLELPAALLEGGAWRAETEGLPSGAPFGERGAGGTLVEPFEGLELLGPAGLIALQASAEGATWSFQDWRREPHDAYRLRIELPAQAGASWRGALVFTRARDSLDDVADFLAEAREAMAERLSLAHEEKLAIRAVECLTAQPAVGSTCELRADLGCTYDDPFDPGEMEVTASVKTPSRSYAIPAFYYVPFEREREGDDDQVHGGAHEWRVRLLPTEPGRHEVRLTVKDRTGELSARPLVIDVAARGWRGLVRVSGSNPLALEWESGEAFCPLGINVFERTDLGKPLPPDRADRCAGQIERLAQGGGNFIRLRMDSWWFAIDNAADVASGYLGAGRFNQRACWDIDRLFEVCERHGVQIMLCIENANANVNASTKPGRRRYNAYLRENGGPCQTAIEFWTDETARELVKRKISYCVARWGASPALAAWEFFNEVILDEAHHADAIIAWHQEMAREFKRVDPHQRLVTTSPMGERDPEANCRLWQVPELDIAQVHDYSRVNTGEVHETAQHGAVTYGKPFLVGEFGILGRLIRSGEFSYASDPEGLVAHLGHWSSALSLAAGAALDWYVKGYVDELDLWDDFGRLAAFVSDLPRTHKQLRSLELAEVTVGPGGPLREPQDVVLAPPQRWEKSPHPRYVVKDDGSIDPPEGLNGIVWGTQYHADLRQPPTFVLDFPQAGRFMAHVIEVVGRGSNPIRITVDGETALEEDLLCEQGRGEKCEVRQPGPDGNLAVTYNRELAVDVTPGQHEVRLENLGRDRMTVQYRLEGYATRERTPSVMVVGLRHSRGAHLWLHNQSWSPEAILGTVRTVPARDARVVLQGLRDGPVELEWWDPMTGERLGTEAAEVRGGRLALSLPELPRDLACKLRYR